MGRYSCLLKEIKTEITTMIYDLAIVGGGPAGAAAGVYASRKRLKTVFITKDWLGQSAVSDKVENWIGTIAITGADLSKNLEQHVKAYSGDVIDFKERESCSKIEKKTDGNFVISTNNGNYEAKTILITTGSHRRKLDVPGADIYENKGLTYCATCDGPLYSDQNVAVIGGGNAAFDGAAQLLAYCKSVTMLSRSHFRADQGTVEKVLQNPKTRAFEHVIPKEVKGEKFVTALIYTNKDTGADTEIPVTGIFVEIGSLPNTDFVKGFVDLDEYNRIVVNPRNQRASIDGVWAAGDVTDGLFHQNNIAAGDAVKAVEDIYLYVHKK